MRFFYHEAVSSVLLLLAFITAVILANSQFSEIYSRFFHSGISLGLGPFHFQGTLLYWINDGLMTLFFFTVGLEIKREILMGELSTFKKAALPAISALGGMLVPAGIYAFFNFNSPRIQGWAIPMATDIAFALGALAVFGRRLPSALRVFLTAFAIADDIGAVLVIAIFYTKSIAWFNLMAGIAFLGLLAVTNMLWIKKTSLYILLGLGVWISVLGSGIHPTVAGVLVSFFIPARGRIDTDRFINNIRNGMAAFRCDDRSCGYSIMMNEKHLNAVKSMELSCRHVEPPLQRMEHVLNPWVAYLILPLFALGNAGLDFRGIEPGAMILHPVSLGIALGLITGKPLGILIFSLLAVKIKIASLPGGIRWRHIFGASMLGGIGFTMSLFISKLSFSDPDLLNISKFGIVFGSIVSAITGIIFLFFCCTSQGKAAGSDQ